MKCRAQKSDLTSYDRQSLHETSSRIFKVTAHHRTFKFLFMNLARQKRAHKIYLQAGMHADEHPGMLVLNHLMDTLEAAEDAGNLNAYFIILPVVNPLGLVHITHHAHRGRYHLTNGLNYNRGWPDFAKMIVADTSVCAKFGDDAAINKKLVRDWIANWLASSTPITALEKQRHIVMRHCFDADMVLDLHCDDVALNHIYIVPQNLPRYQGLQTHGLSCHLTGRRFRRRLI